MDSILRDFPYPGDIEFVREKIEGFVHRHAQKNRKVAVVTSGGTAVPLEINTVRFIDNFSTGTRGSAAAEIFNEVLDPHKSKECQFLDTTREQRISRDIKREGAYKLNLKHFYAAAKNDKLINLLCQKENPDGSESVCLDQAKAPKLISTFKAYQDVKKENMLLEIEFVTLCEYLNLLRVSSEAVSKLNKRALMFLAAAVADFYVPPHTMPEHKLQSAEGPPEIRLCSVPKVIPFLVHEWAKDAFVVTFKLETDQTLLIPKAQQALQKYKHEVVVANILETRRHRVDIVTPGDHTTITVTSEELAEGVELEEKLSAHLVSLHGKFVDEG